MDDTENEAWRRRGSRKRRTSIHRRVEQVNPFYDSDTVIVPGTEEVHAQAAGANFSLVSGGAGVMDMSFTPRDDVERMDLPQFDEEVVRKVKNWAENETKQRLMWAASKTMHFMNVVSSTVFMSLNEMVRPTLFQPNMTGSKTGDLASRITSLTPGGDIPSMLLGTQSRAPPAPSEHAVPQGARAKAGERETFITQNIDFEPPPFWNTEFGVIGTASKNAEVSLPAGQKWMERALLMTHFMETRITGIQWTHEHLRGAIEKTIAALLAELPAETWAPTDEGWLFMVGLRSIYFKAREWLRSTRKTEPDMSNVDYTVETFFTEKLKDRFTDVDYPRKQDDREISVLRSLVINEGRLALAEDKAAMFSPDDLINNGTEEVRTLFGVLVGMRMLADRVFSAAAREPQHVMNITRTRLHSASREMLKRLERVDRLALQTESPHKFALAAQPAQAFDLLKEPSLVFFSDDVRWTARKKRMPQRMRYSDPRIEALAETQRIVCRR